MIDDLIKEAKRIEEDSLFSSKSQFEAGKIWTSLHYWIGIPSSILAAIAGVSAFIDLFANGIIIAVVISMLVATLAALHTFLNPNEKAVTYRYFGNKFNSLRNNSRIFYNIECKKVDEPGENLVLRLKQLSDTRSDLNEKCPQVSFRAFARARKGIEEGEADYETDD